MYLKAIVDVSSSNNCVSLLTFHNEIKLLSVSVHISSLAETNSKGNMATTLYVHL